MKNLGKSFYTRYKDYLPALGAIIALGVISTILIDGFMNVNSIGAILLRSSVLAMVAMGVTFVVIAGDSGLDLSTGALMVVGAMIGPNLRVGGEESLILSFLLVFVVGAANGWVQGPSSIYQWPGRLFPEDPGACHDHGDEWPCSWLLYHADPFSADRQHPQEPC